MKNILILIIVAILLLFAVVILCLRFQKGDSELQNSKNNNNDSQKKCNSCRQPIDSSANVCQHCSRSQNLLGKLGQTIPIIVSIVMMMTSIALVILAVIQFKQAHQKNVDASMALLSANTAVTKANDTILKLRNLAKPLAEFTFSAVARTGLRITELSRRDQYRLVKELESKLSEIGMTEEEVGACKENWHSLNLESLSWPIVKPINKLFLEKKNEQYDKQKNFKSPIPAGDPNYKAIHEYLQHIFSEERKFKAFYNDRSFETFYSDMIHFMKTTDVFTEKDKDDFLRNNNEELQDLAYYSKHKKFRRLEHWLDSKE